MNSILKKLPPMLMGEELVKELEIMPRYDDKIQYASESERLIALSDIYGVFAPTMMSREIYSKIYLSIIRSLQKKETKMATQQLNENHKSMKGKEYTSVINAADCFTIIGPSGVGKSASISRAVNMIMENQVIVTENPYTKIIPCIVVQCPFDCSIKNALLSILRLVDERIGTNHYNNAIKSRAPVDLLVSSVATIAHNHIALIVIDEVQNLIHHRAGNTLIACLTQLINHAGISMCLVGTPEVAPFFEQAYQLARRTLGLTYQQLEYGEEFREFCMTLFQYQYVRNRTEITEGIIHFLYEHSAGNLSVVVSLIHDAQEIAILEKKEVLNIETLQRAYQKRLTMLHSFIAPKRRSQTSRVKTESLKLQVVENLQEDVSIKTLILRAKNEGKVPADYLEDYITVEKVKI